MKRAFCFALSSLLALSLVGCSSIQFSEDELALKLGETGQLEATTEDGPITYSSSDEAILTVDENGEITTVNVGEATVTATNSKGKEAECKVIVSHVEPTEISFPEADYSTGVGKSIVLEAVFAPENTTDFALTWESDNTDIAAVDESGTVTGVSAGSATIIATSGNGVSGSCNISVLPLPEAISIDGSLDLTEGDSHTVDVTFSPEGCFSENVIWTSSDESVVKISDGKITAVSTGTATITAETEDTHLTATCTVKVTPAPLTVSGVSLSKSAAVAGTMYNVNFNLTAGATGGTGNYSYKFEVVQGGSVTKNTGFTKNNSISANISGYGTCTVKITVKDSSGATATETVNLLS